MNFPPSSTSKPFQLSIKSFFQPRRPEYTPPPPQQLPQAESTPSQAPEPPAQLDPRPVHAPAQIPAHASATGPDPSPRPLPSIPLEAAIRPLTPDDIQPLKRINALLLPVTYPEAFYNTALTSEFTRVITWADPVPKVVGGIICRLEPIVTNDGTTNEQALYIQSLALLSPYRAHGLATAAFADLLRAAAARNSTGRNPAIRFVYAHVWTENEDGLRWYAARNFIRDPNPLERYYFKLRPDTAYIVRRNLSPPLPSSPSSSSSQMGNNASTPSPPHAGRIGPSATAGAANLPSISGPPTSSSSPLPPPPPLSSRSQEQRQQNKSNPPANVSRPPPSARGESFQNRRAETEWNDLPPDMVSPNGLLAPQRTTGASGDVSEASSMSSSTTTGRRKKEKRAYPSAAFGN